MSAIGTIQSAWQGLSDSDRNLWNAVTPYVGAFQKHNSTAKLTPQQLFIRYNMIRLWSGRPILITPQFTQIPYVNPEPMLYIDNGDFRLLIQFGVGFNNYEALFKITMPLRPSLTSIDNYLKSFTAGLAVDNDFSIKAQYLALYGITPVVGDVVALSIREYSATSPDIKNEQIFRLTIVAYNN